MIKYQRPPLHKRSLDIRRAPVESQAYVRINLGVASLAGSVWREDRSDQRVRRIRAGTSEGPYDNALRVVEWARVPKVMGMS